jgi:hypothetical protein
MVRLAFLSSVPRHGASIRPVRYMPQDVSMSRWLALQPPSPHSLALSLCSCSPRMSALIAEQLLLPNLDPSQVLGLVPGGKLKVRSFGPLHVVRVDRTPGIGAFLHGRRLGSSQYSDIG